MKKIFEFLLSSLLFATFLSTSSFAMLPQQDDPAIGGIAPVRNDAKDSSTTQRPLLPVIHKLNENFYAGISERGIGFGMVRLDLSNAEVWNTFVCNQKTKGIEIRKRELSGRDFKTLPPETQKFLKFVWPDPQAPDEPAVLNGSEIFYRSLVAFYENQMKSEMWIAYALAGKVFVEIPPTLDTLPHIEMAVTVLTTEMAPFVLHRGIMRNIDHLDAVFRGELPQHPKLSMNLHGFAAACMRKHTPYREWMITYPFLNMKEIFNSSGLNMRIGKANMPYTLDENGLQVFDERKNRICIVSPENLDSSAWAFLKDLPPIRGYAVTLRGLESKWDSVTEGSVATVGDK